MKQRDWPEWAKEEFEERSAICQYSGCMTRDRAERFARELVHVKLCRQQGTLPFVERRPA